MVESIEHLIHAFHLGRDSAHDGFDEAVGASTEYALADGLHVVYEAQSAHLVLYPLLAIDLDVVQ